MDDVLDYLWEELHRVAGATGRHDNAAFRALYVDICVALHPQMALEIGAHEAGFSRELAGRLPQCRVTAFEANPHVHRKFSPRMPAGVTYLNQAVGGDARPRTLYIPKVIGNLALRDSNKISSLRTRVADDVIHESVTCACTTVDDYVRANGAPDRLVLWIDAEGATQDVLSGATDALRTSVCALFVEVETEAIWSGQWLASDVARHLRAHGLQPLARDLETEWQYNQIFIREHLLSSDVRVAIAKYLRDLLRGQHRQIEGTDWSE